MTMSFGLLEQLGHWEFGIWAICLEGEREREDRRMKRLRWTTAAVEVMNWVQVKMGVEVGTREGIKLCIIVLKML